MDAGIGRILDALEAAGQLSNTLVIFSGDNGMSMGHHGIFGKGQRHLPHEYVRLGGEGAPDLEPPGPRPGGCRVRRACQPLRFVPHHPRMGGTPLYPQPRPARRKLRPLLTGEKSSVRDDVVVFDEYGPVRMVRTKEWKYIHRYPYGPHELYDLVRDPGEERNLIDDPAAQSVKERLIDRLNHWYAAYADPACDGKGESGSRPWPAAPHRPRQRRQARLYLRRDAYECAVYRY